MDNDWTSAQVAKYPTRLIGFCSVNPTRLYAVEEIDRCAKDPNLRNGLKLHLGNSDVDVDNPDHLVQLKHVFRAASRNRMTILVHAHANVNFQRPYGAAQARVFLEKLLPEAQDIAIVLAHMAGAGEFDESTQRAFGVYAEAIAHHDPQVRNLYFDACISATADEAPLLAQRIREIGVSRVFYGSDAPVKGNLPAEALDRWHKLPLTAEEFHAIETNPPRSYTAPRYGRNQAGHANLSLTTTPRMDTHSAASSIVEVPSRSLNCMTALRSHNAQGAPFNGPAPYGSQHPVPAPIPGGLRAIQSTI